MMVHGNISHRDLLVMVCGNISQQRFALHQRPVSAP